jgi:hypothetical protein
MDLTVILPLIEIILMGADQETNVAITAMIGGAPLKEARHEEGVEGTEGLLALQKRVIRPRLAGRMCRLRRHLLLRHYLHHRRW